MGYLSAHHCAHQLATQKREDTLPEPLHPSDELIRPHEQIKTHWPITSSMSRSAHPSLTIYTDKVYNQKNCKLPGNSYRQRERMKTRHRKNLEQTNEVWLQVLCSGHVPAVSLVRLAATLWWLWLPLLFLPFKKNVNIHLISKMSASQQGWGGNCVYCPLTRFFLWEHEHVQHVCMHVWELHKARET